MTTAKFIRATYKSPKTLINMNKKKTAHTGQNPKQKRFQKLQNAKYILCLI